MINMEAKRRFWFISIFSSLMLASSCGNQFWRQNFPRPLNFINARPRFPWLQSPSSVPHLSSFGTNSNVPFEVIHAEVDIVAAAGSGVSGKILFTQELPGNIVTVNGQIFGLKPGLHGFHIHSKGDLGDDCKNAGPHFNPFKQNHGAPFAFTRHVGDLGNVKTSSNSGTASFTLRDSKISLQRGAENSIVGLAVVVHDGEDDLGFGGDEESLKTGNAGTRVGCGIIRILA